jgi:hypothetical protein
VEKSEREDSTGLRQDLPHLYQKVALFRSDPVPGQ